MLHHEPANLVPASEGISSNASGSLIIKPCVQAEIEFYESAKDHPLFQAHIPTFIGSLSQHEDQDLVAPLLKSAQDGVAPAAQVVTNPTPGLIRRATWKPSGGKKLSTGTAVVLENVTSGFAQPNVMDVKLGARLWDEDAPLSKRRKLDEVASRTTTGSLGFRVAGMKIWGGPEGHIEVSPTEKEFVEIKNGYKSYTKFYGQSFNAENVIDAFTAYFGGIETAGDEAVGKKFKFKYNRADFLIKRFIRELESVKYVLENEESRMYSASVLMVYEGDEKILEESLAAEGKEDDENELEDDVDEDDDDEDEETKPHKVHEMRLIDFAHAKWTPGEGPDENALQGIKCLIDILRTLVVE